MSQNNFRKTFALISFGLILLVVGGVMSKNSNTTIDSDSSIQIDREKAPPKSEIALEYLLVPVLHNPENETYKAHPTGTPIQTSNNIPIAKLQDEAAELAKRVSVSLAEHAEFYDDNAISFLVLSSIRYEMENGVVYVSTSLPSPEALKTPLSFSGDQITLDNGREAWLQTHIDSETMPNNINFIEGDSIVTITGNVSIEQLKTISAKVVIAK